MTKRARPCLGGHGSIFASAASGSFAWSGRLAQQSLQADFEPGLVLLFDKQAQGASRYARLGDDERLSLTIDGITGQAVQASLSNPFGFADFFAGGDTGGDMVRVASPLAVAETVGGQDDQTSGLRMRQGGRTCLTCYIRVAGRDAAFVDSVIARLGDAARHVVFRVKRSALRVTQLDAGQKGKRLVGRQDTENFGGALVNDLNYPVVPGSQRSV